MRRKQRPPVDSPLRKALDLYERRKAYLSWVENLPVQGPRLIEQMEAKIAHLQKDIAYYKDCLVNRDNLLREAHAKMAEAERDFADAKIGEGALCTPKAKLEYEKTKLIKQLVRLQQRLHDFRES